MRMFALLLAAGMAPATLAAQMVSPLIDRSGEPFSYFSRPTDVIGVMDAPAATLVGPEGFFYTGYGELMLFAGNPAEPLNQRVKTLEKGYLPVIDYSTQRDGFVYRVKAFTASLDGRPEGTLVNFIRVSVRNLRSDPRTAWLGTAMRYQGEVNSPDLNVVPDNRFPRPAEPEHKGGYRQLGEKFNPDWVYGFDGQAFVRDGRAMYFFPASPAPARHLTMKEGYDEPSNLAPHKLGILSTTPAGFVQYRLTLRGNEEVTLDFKMPVVPVKIDAPERKAIEAAPFDAMHAQVVEGWEQILNAGMEIHVPEAKVNDTFRANLIYDLIARDKLGDDYVQTVNKFHYHAFWLRDSSYIVRMYDLTGYPQYAAQDLAFFARWQQPDGNFVSQGGQFDGWGQTMWAYGEHTRITGDLDFARRVYPAMQKAVEWLRQARAKDPLHIIPVTSPGDNEDISGHVTGHNFWALAGLKNVILVAKALGETADAAAYQAEYDDYYRAFHAALEKQTAATGGAIAPGLDVRGGQDWGNMLAVYPEKILDPHDPMVTATLQATRAKYREGVMTYGDGRWLHHYLTLKNTETETIRGDQRWAVEELYAELLHTSSTHAGFEFAIRPWGTRDFHLNLSPHGWFSAKFRAALRNMLVREEDNDLYLLSVVSPEWIRPGEEIRVRRAPTDFGTVNFTLKSLSATEAQLTFDASFRQRPGRVLVHVPWFMEVKEALADGKPVTASDVIELPAGAQQLTLRWQRKPETPVLNYGRAVEEYKREYRRRYDEFLRTGEIQRP
ncbi:MAG: hypothetical protein P4M01_02270 [Acidobacteriota bacterium]|nr:hypothetical protein [Acidobacteriota bacterium]